MRTIRIDQLKSLTERLVQHIDYSIERCKQDISDSSDLREKTFESSSERYAYISGYLKACINDNIRAFNSLNLISNEILEFCNFFVKSTDFFSEYENSCDRSMISLFDCMTGLIHASQTIKFGTKKIETADYVRGSINDLCKVLEFLDYKDEAKNIRNQIKISN